jgi:hypothetical protein
MKRPYVLPDNETGRTREAENGLIGRPGEALWILLYVSHTRYYVLMGYGPGANTSCAGADPGMGTSYAPHECSRRYGNGG